jgi:putative hydrolase of the HAD superfamily
VNNIDWKNLRAVILDVDGTLYDQTKLRRKMFYALLKYYSIRPLQLKDLLILYHFRAEREKRFDYCGTDLDNEQYQWCAAKVAAPLDRIKWVISKWIFEFPTTYLLSCRFEGISSLIELLVKHNIKVAVYSDYQATDKLKSLQIKADLIIASTDPKINCMKPQQKALVYIMNTLNVNHNECLFIGDRYELDGECAKRANIPYLDVKMYDSDAPHFYKNIVNSLVNFKIKIDDD